jgi:hypothetical protein
MEAPPAKKPRSEAQKAAFEKAKAAREANILKKFQANQAVLKPESTAEETTEEPEPVEEELASGAATYKRSAFADASPAEPEVDSQSSTPLAQSGGCTPVQEEGEEHEYVSFDPDELREQISSTQSELRTLREAMAGLHSKHSELEQSWQQHNVKTNNLLNFV